MKITIAISTYNRKNILKDVVKSLELVQKIEQCNIRVYDDCSNEFSINDLKEIFSFSKEIIVRERNMGADINMYQMYKDFLNTDDDIFIQADSDLIFDKDLINFVIESINKTDGIMSLYNSKKHKKIQAIGEFVIKKDLGGAGTVFKREILQEIIREVPCNNCYDWAWSNFLVKKGIKLYCSKRSYFQHIGFYGQNCNGINFDYGLNFKDLSETNQLILNKVYKKYFQNMTEQKDLKIVLRYIIKIIKNSMINCIEKIFGVNVVLYFFNIKGKMKRKEWLCK